MNYYKIRNIVLPSGAIDYKGFDIDKFTAGYQRYSHDMSFCVIATPEEYSGKSLDVNQITSEEYQNLRILIEQSTPPSTEDRLRATEDAISALLGL